METQNNCNTNNYIDNVKISLLRYSSKFATTSFCIINVYQKCLAKMFTKNVYQKCLPKMFTKNVYQKCLPRMFTKNVYQKYTHRILKMNLIYIQVYVTTMYLQCNHSMIHVLLVQV